MFDCWKKSCHGATVVPTMAMMSRIAVELNPPFTPGTTNPWRTGAPWGWENTANGMTRKLAKMKMNMNRSHRWKLPDAVMAMSIAAAIGTEIVELTPKYCRARLTPMNSVTIVRKFRTKRSPTEKRPQNPEALVDEPGVAHAGHRAQAD